MYFQIGLCFISRHIGVFEISLVLFLMFSTQVTNQLELKIKIVLGKDYIKLYSSVAPLNVFFIALALVKFESYQQLIKIC